MTWADRIAHAWNAGGAGGGQSGPDRHGGQRRHRQPAGGLGWQGLLTAARAWREGRAGVGGGPEVPSRSLSEGQTRSTPPAPGGRSDRENRGRDPGTEARRHGRHARTQASESRPRVRAGRHLSRPARQAAAAVAKAVAAANIAAAATKEAIAQHAGPPADAPAASKSKAGLLLLLLLLLL